MSLRKELQSEQVAYLDLSRCCHVENSTAVQTVLAEMREKGSSVCLVLKDGRLAGIITDRDVLRKVVAAPESWKAPVETVMTPDPITVPPDMSATDALSMMDKHHFRNLPVVDKDGRILGNMTHQTIVDFLATRYPVEVLNRPPRPEQFPRKAEGGD